MQGSGCPSVFFTAVQEEGEAELGRFTRAIELSDAPRAAEVRAGLRPETWEAALALAVEGATRAKPLILVIDELPYLAAKEPSIEAVLQMVWDRAFQGTPVLLILIGSDEATMAALTEQERPLYDRAREMVVQPLSRHLLAEKRVVRRLTPYSTRPAPKTALWELVDPYMRFWLRFVNRKVDLIERGRGSLLLDDFRESWPSFRGRAIESLVRDSLERLLPDRERFGAARYAGSYWNRSGSVEVDLVGGDTWPVAKRVTFVGSIKWRARQRFGRADALELAARRAQVPGASEKTLLVGVSSRGFDPDVPLDAQLSPQDLLGAWRHDE